MKKVKYICTIVLLAVCMITATGCGKLSKSQKKFAKERGFDPTNIPAPTVVDTESHDNIEITFYSQFGTIDTSGAMCLTSQYMDSEDGIDQIEACYYFMWQALDILSVPNVNYLDVVTIGDKDYLYAQRTNGEEHLYYPVDDGHFLDILVKCVNHWDNDAAHAASVKNLRELMAEDNFASMIMFDISGAGKLTKDASSYGGGNSDDEMYAKNTTDEDIVSEDGIVYVKNQLLLTAKIGADRSLVEELGAAYGFEIVGYISIVNDYQIEFYEDKSYSELEGLIEEFERLDWVSYCSLNTVMETGLD